MTMEDFCAKVGKQDAGKTEMDNLGVYSQNERGQTLVPFAFLPTLRFMNALFDGNVY